MADYTTSKPALGGQFPGGDVIDAHPWGRVEPLVKPDQVTSRYLFGVPLVSATMDPITKMRAVMTPEVIQDIIQGAVSRVELDTGLDIFPVQRQEKHGFDRQLYDSFGYMRTHHQPIASVEKLSVTPSNQVDVYNVPLDWLEAGNFYRGQVNIVPLTIAFQGGGFVPSQSAGGAAFLSILGAKNWIPAYWQLVYTTGFPDGRIPRMLNDLISIYAAIDILGMLGATNRNASHSLGIDGMSQSISSAGPEVYASRIQKLEEQRVAMLNKMKAKSGKKFLVSNV